jgi:undecaprenyl-diphosphatase
MEWLQTLDHNVLGWFQAHRLPALDTVMTFVTFLGEEWVVLLVAVLASVALAVRRRRRTAFLFATTCLLCWLFSQAVKETVRRPRPDFPGHPLAPVSLLHPDQPTFSFPSVHSSGSASVYVTLALLVAKGWPRRRRVLLVAGSLLLTGLIGLSRVYLGFHYPTDVLAGWAVGLGFAFGCAALDQGRTPPPLPGDRRSEERGSALRGGSAD